MKNTGSIISQKAIDSFQRELSKVRTGRVLTPPDRVHLRIPRKHRRRDTGWILWLAAGVLGLLLLMKLAAPHS